MGGKRVPPLAGLDAPPHAAARRPGRLGSAHPSARSLEATARIGAGAAGLALALAPREAPREKARPALPVKMLCGLYGSRLPRLPSPMGASRRRKVCSGPPMEAMMLMGWPPPRPPRPPPSRPPSPNMLGPSSRPSMLGAGSGGAGGPHSVRQRGHEVFLSSHC